MKKLSILAMLFCFGGVALFNACGSSKDKVTGGTGLPEGWYYDITSTAPIKVGDTVALYVQVRNAQNEVVPDAELPVSLSSGVWSVTPADAGDLQETTGAVTHFTARKAYDIEQWYIWFRVNGKGNGYSVKIQP